MEQNSIITTTSTENRNISNEENDSFTNFKLILVDINEKLCEAFKEHFDGLPNVTIVHDKFENLPVF